MSAITEKQEAQKAAAAAKKAEAEADIKAIAKLFSSPEGKHVLKLLMQRFGVLAPRFVQGPNGEVNAIRAGIRDGRADVPLFIIGCLKEAGETEISFPL